MVAQALKSRWLAGLIHAGLWLLLYLTVIRMGSGDLLLSEYAGRTTNPQSPAPVQKLASLFAPGTFSSSFVDTNRMDPFYTRHFMAPAPPPPPTTRKIPVVFQGFYITEEKPKRAIFKLADAFVTVPLGGEVATNIYLAEVNALSMTLTNVQGQTNVLLLNKAGEIEVPIR